MRLASLAVIAALSLAVAACGSTRTAEQMGKVCDGPSGGAMIAASSSTSAPAPYLPPATIAAAASPSRDLTLDPRNAPLVTGLAQSMAMRAGPRPGKNYYVLAISAGGQWGAYGVGILVGQQHSGAPPPKPDMVTGISTGAMIAPLAFLGDYNSLRTLYTTLKDTDVYTERGDFSLLYADSIADDAPLKAKLAGIVDDDFVKRIAAEGAKGRILAVQSVDIDEGRSVAFDLTAIAQGRSHPCGKDVSARDCIISAIIAAASIPVAFPPTFIKGEMFVDGGLLQAAFALNLAHRVARRPAASAGAANSEQDFVLPGNQGKDTDAVAIDLTLLANSDFQTDPTCTQNGFLQIAERAAEIAVDQIAVGSFYRLLTETLAQDGGAARYSFADPALTRCLLDPSATTGILDAFNTAYMQCLYRAACSMAAADNSRIWHTNPEDLPRSPLITRSHGVSSAASANIPAVCQPATAS